MSWKIKCVSLSFLTMFWVGCYADQVRPENHTSTTMYPLKRRILRFAGEQNRVPENLSELPPVKDFIDPTTDVWGNEIKYIVEGTTISLISYGKDQKPGGTGDNLDVVGVFEAKTADGNWRGEERSDEKADWNAVPLGDKRY